MNNSNIISNSNSISEDKNKNENENNSISNQVIVYKNTENDNAITYQNTENKALNEENNLVASFTNWFKKNFKLKLILLQLFC